MAKNLLLVKYNLDKDGRYLEDSAETIESSFVSEKFVKLINNIAPIANLTVFEEEGSDAKSIAECLQNEKIDEILDLIKKEFVRSIKDAEKDGYENDEEVLGELISKFRWITNVCHILEIKNSKYKSDDCVIVKLG